jgi:hypothetical protein
MFSSKSIRSKIIYLFKVHVLHSYSIVRPSMFYYKSIKSKVFIFKVPTPLMLCPCNSLMLWILSPKCQKFSKIKLHSHSYLSIVHCFIHSSWFPNIYVQSFLRCSKGNIMVFDIYNQQICEKIKTLVGFLQNHFKVPWLFLLSSRKSATFPN